MDPFVVDGLARGDQVVHIVEDRDAYQGGLSQRADIAPAIESGQLRIQGWDQAYLPHGRFSALRMLAYLRQALRDGAALGYPGVRLIGDMEWAQDGVTGVEDLIAYEAEVDTLLRRPRDVIICAYDVQRHSASRIASVVAAHRAVFVEGRLHQSEAPITRPTPRDRILSAAARLFTYGGVRATGVDALIEDAGVAKATFYRHFPSKDDLIVAWLEDPRTSWFAGVRAQAEQRASSGAEVVLAFFDAVADRLEAEDFRGNPVLNTSVEITDATHPAAVVIRRRIEGQERYFQDTLAAAGYRDSARLGTGLQTLLTGAISLGVASRTSTRARVAREIAAQLLDTAERTEPPGQ